MFGDFTMLCMKGLKGQIQETDFVVFNLEDIKTFISQHSLRHSLRYTFLWYIKTSVSD